MRISDIKNIAYSIRRAVASGVWMAAAMLMLASCASLGRGGAGGEVTGVGGSTFAEPVP